MSKLNELKELAERVSGGHYTILSFTGIYRVALGTMSPQGYFDHRLQIDDMPSGKTLEEAIENCIKEEFNFWERESYGDIGFDEWERLNSLTREERNEIVEIRNESIYEQIERLKRESKQWH